MTDTDWLCDAYLDEDELPGDIYRLAVPIWCGQSHEELAARLGHEYACGFAYGFECGVVMAMLGAEWAQAAYFLLKQHYLMSHPEEDPQSWERHAERTTRDIPICRLSPELPLDRLQGFVPFAAPRGVKETM